MTLKANFTKFNSDSLRGSSDGTVNKQPFLHVYWTSCMVSVLVALLDGRSTSVSPQFGVLREIAFCKSIPQKTSVYVMLKV